MNKHVNCSRIRMSWILKLLMYAFECAHLYKLKWRDPDEEGIVEFLVKEKQFK